LIIPLLDVLPDNMYKCTVSEDWSFFKEGSNK